MRRWIPHPLLSLALVVFWLLLTRFTPGHLVLGTVVALIAGWAVSALQPDQPRIRRWTAAIRLAGIVGYDIIRSNGAVAWLIMTGARRGSARSGFVEIPLRLRDESALALLAMIVTATPGTAWLDYEPRSGTLLLHILDLVDEEGWRTLIRERYEVLLLEIFE